jgi:hypothetical protein
MELFIRKPSVDLFRGIRVDKDTAIEYTGENVKQTIKDLVFRQEMTVKGECFDGSYVTNVYLSEGDVLIFESEERGYVKPVEGFCTVAEALDDLANIKEMGG